MVDAGVHSGNRHNRLLASLGFSISGGEKVNDSAQQTPILPGSRRRVLAEIVLIFAVFAIQGAWPVPDVNEPYYLGKAIHYWNPDWLHGDFFMESPDTHKVFYFTFGWLSLWLPPVALAWTGRILSWALLAWAWRRLSFAVVPKAWWSVLTAALFGCLMERCQMAGEWVIGGVEAKPFAYVFVLLGIESLVRDRWNRALVLFGAAAAFHVLVGGWAAVAAGIAWFVKPRPVVAVAGATAGRGFTEGTKRIWSLWPGVVGGLLFSLPGVIPSIALDWGVDRATAQAAHVIYVFERLPHHLTLTGIRPEFIVRLALLWAFWLLLGRWSRRTRFPEDQRQPLFQLRAFVSGTVAITLAGVVVNSLMFLDRALAADFLRYYWYRLTDVALPLGVALEGAALIVGSRRVRACTNAMLLEDSRQATNSRELTAPGEPTKRLRGLLAPGYCWLILAILVAAFHIGDRMLNRLFPAAPRSHRIANFADWYGACQYATDSGNIPPNARFLVPRDAQTFQWYTGRRVVVDWKDVPQDAESLRKWWRRIQDIYATGFPEGPRWYEPLAGVGAERLRELGAEYHADYIISERTDPLLNLPVVYQNETYVIHRIE